MPVLCKAILTALVAALAAAGVLDFFGAPTEVSASVCTALMGFVPQIRDSLEKMAAAVPLRSVNIVPFDSYGLNPARMVFQGGFWLFAVMNLNGVFAGIAYAITSATLDELGNLIGLFAFGLVLPFCVILGHWIGRRCMSNGLLATVGMVLLARIVNSFFDHWLLDAELYSAIYGEGKGAWVIMKQSAFALAWLTPFVLLGYWWGRKKRLTSYMSCLLRKLPDDSRIALLQLAYEEASRLARHVPDTSSGTAAIAANASRRGRASVA